MIENVAYTHRTNLKKTENERLIYGPYEFAKIENVAYGCIVRMRKEKIENVA